MKKLFSNLLFVAISVLILTGCGSASADDKKIKIGATAGPYSDQLKEGIIPILEKDGYKVEIVEFNDYIQPNNALDEENIDANLFQNRIYLQNFNESHDMDLLPAYGVPTAPIALYSEKHTVLEDVKEGMTVTLPNDPTNLARSLHMMEGYGWITINKDVNPTTASEKDVATNKYNLKIQPLDAAQTPRSLSDADFAFVNGNFALASGLKLKEAVDVEKTSEDYLIYLTIRKDDEDKPFAKALKAAYHSDEFLAYTKEHAAGYVLPPYQAEKE
jgi:D-methionine transport system substrate-binding protein